MSENSDGQESRKRKYPKICETDECYRDAIYIIKGANPPEYESRVVCRPCYKMFRWCGGVPYSDVSSRQIRRSDES